jgi:hypothetical protein
VCDVTVSKRQCLPISDPYHISPEYDLRTGREVCQMNGPEPRVRSQVPKGEGPGAAGIAGIGCRKPKAQSPRGDWAFVSGFEPLRRGSKATGCTPRDGTALRSP